jgi:hypothetical protein
MLHAAPGHRELLRAVQVQERGKKPESSNADS